MANPLGWKTNRTRTLKSAWTRGSSKRRISPSRTTAIFKVNKTIPGNLEKVADNTQITVGDRFFSKTNVQIKPGQRLRWNFPSNAELHTGVQEGWFRDDLFFRLRYFLLTVPPLRTRQEDIPMLAQHFLRQHAQRYRKRLTGFDGWGGDRYTLQQLQDTVFENRSRPCLLHQIRRCTAPCTGKIAPEPYAEDVANALLFLEGREDDVIRRLSEKMAAASDAQRYEEAGRLAPESAELSFWAGLSQVQRGDTDGGVERDPRLSGW